MSKRLSPGAAAATELRRSWHRLLWNMGLESLKGEVGYRAPAPGFGFWVFARGLPQGSFGADGDYMRMMSGLCRNYEDLMGFLWGL